MWTRVEGTYRDTNHKMVQYYVDYLQVYWSTEASVKKGVYNSNRYSTSPTTTTTHTTTTTTTSSSSSSRGSSSTTAVGWITWSPSATHTRPWALFSCSNFLVSLQFWNQTSRKTWWHLRCWFERVYKCADNVS